MEGAKPKSPQKTTISIKTIDPLVHKFLKNSPNIGDDEAGKLFLLDIIENLVEKV